MEWGSNDEDRRGIGRLSEEELEAIARRASELVWESFERQVGKTAIRLFLWVCGAAGVIVLSWLGLEGKVKL